ncbi:hypothetical protein BDZ89DRAFT_1213777 [Hymenopellis radicata]|nr:hypothetical protein BDZ89DRAFT_1213777 [Hymenopellis radicata]
MSFDTTRVLIHGGKSCGSNDCDGQCIKHLAKTELPDYGATRVSVQMTTVIVALQTTVIVAAWGGLDGGSTEVVGRSEVLDGREVRSSVDESVLYQLKTTFSFRGRRLTILQDANPSPGGPVTVGAIHWDDRIVEILGQKKKLSQSSLDSTSVSM